MRSHQRNSPSGGLHCGDLPLTRSQDLVGIECIYVRVPINWRSAECSERFALNLLNAPAG